FDLDMKKIIYTLAVLVGMNSCEKEKFNYSPYQVDVSEIDSVYFSTGSPTLIADNKASLQFVLEAFRSVQIKNDEGKLVDSMLQVDYQSLPASAVKIYADGKLVDGMEYKTSNATAGTIKFY